MLVLPCFARSAGSLRLNLSASHRFRRVQVFAPVSLRVPRYGDLEAESGRGVSGIGRFTAGGHRSTGMGGSSPFLSRSLRFVSRKLGLVAGWPRHRPLRRRWLAARIPVCGSGWHPRSEPRRLQCDDPFGVNRRVGGAAGVARGAGRGRARVCRTAAL